MSTEFKGQPYAGSLDEHMVHVFGYSTPDEWENVRDDAKNIEGKDLAWPTVATMGTGKAGIREAFRLVQESVFEELLGEIGYAGARVSKEEKEYLGRVERSRWVPEDWDANKHHRTWWLKDGRRKNDSPYACIVERIMELHQ